MPSNGETTGPQSSDNDAARSAEYSIPGDPPAMLKRSMMDISANESAAYFMRLIPERFLTKFQPEELGENPIRFAYGYMMAYVTDFESAKTRPLCFLEGCAHESPDCAAWIRARTAGKMLIAAEDRLFWINMNYAEPESFGTEPDIFHLEEEPACIEVSDLDGSGKRRIYTAEPNDSIDDSGFFYDSTKVIFIENGRRAYQTMSLVTVDIETGEVESRLPIPHEFSETEMLNVIGAYNNKPLFLKTSMTVTAYEGDALPSLVAAPTEYHGIERLFSMDPRSGELTDILSIDYNQDTPYRLSDVFTGSVIIGLNNTTREIYEIDIETGKVQVTGTLPEDYEDVYFGSNTPIDGKMLLYSGWPSNLFYLDIQTGVVTENTFLGTGYAGDHWPTIIADAGEEYLVVVGMTENGVVSRSPIEYYDSVSGWGGNRYIYAMMHKEAFRGGAEIYREVILIA